MIQKRVGRAQALSSNYVPHFLVHDDEVGAQHIEASLAQFTRDVVAGTATMSDETKVVIEGIHGAMEVVLNNTELSFKEDQKEVNRTYDAIKDCDQNVVEGMSSEFANLTLGREVSHNECRVAETLTKEIMDSRCQGFQSMIAQVTPPAFPIRPSAWTYSEVQKFIMFAETYQSWATEYSANLEIAKQECNASTLNHTVHRSTCNRFQAVFETELCEVHSESIALCSSYDNCRSKTVTARSEVHEAVAKVEAARKAEYIAAKHVQCYVSVLNAEVREQVGRLNMCEGAAVGTAHLDITYHAAPDILECDTSRLGQPPCHDEFLSLHYTSKSWYNEAPTEACSSCPDVLPTSAPTSVPTRALTPAPMPAPTPSPDTSTGKNTMPSTMLTTAAPTVVVPAPGENVTVWSDADDKVYQVYKMEAVSGPFGNDVDKAFEACAQRSGGKPLGMYTHKYFHEAMYNDCGGRVYALQHATGLLGIEETHGQLAYVFPSDTLVGNYNSCNGHSTVPGAPRYVYQRGWETSVPMGAKLICAELLP